MIIQLECVQTTLKGTLIPFLTNALINRCVKNAIAPQKFSGNVQMDFQFVWKQEVHTFFHAVNIHVKLEDSPIIRCEFTRILIRLCLDDTVHLGRYALCLILLWKKMFRHCCGLCRIG